MDIFSVTLLRGGGGTGGKSPFPLLSEPISPSSLLFSANFSLLPKRLRFLFSLLPTFSPYFSLLPTFFRPFLPPPYSVPPPSKRPRHYAWGRARTPRSRVGEILCMLQKFLFLVHVFFMRIIRCIVPPTSPSPTAEK